MTSLGSKETSKMATDAVLIKSEPMPAGTPIVRGYDFNRGIDHHALLQSFLTSGFQATNFGLAVEEINKMVQVFRIIFLLNEMNS